MKKLLLVSAVINAVLLSIPVMAETVTYSDKYISFDYDGDVPCVLYSSGYDTVTIQMETAEMEEDFVNASSVSIVVGSKASEETIKSRFIDGNDFYDVETVAEDPLEVNWIYKEYPFISHCKLLGKNDNQYAYILFHERSTGTDQNNACKLIYDTAQLSCDLNETEIPETWFNQRASLIYNTLLFSKDILAYLEGDVALCERLVKGENGFTLGIEANRIRDSVETIADNSGYRMDKIISNYFMPSDYLFSSEQINDAIDTELTLQEVIALLGR